MSLCSHTLSINVSINLNNTFQRACIVHTFTAYLSRPAPPQHTASVCCYQMLQVSMPTVTSSLTEALGLPLKRWKKIELVECLWGPWRTSSHLSSGWEGVRGRAFAYQ